MQPRGFVRAVLVPHRRENPELGETRHPADQLEDALILVRLQAVAGDEFGGDLRLVHEVFWRLGSLIREIARGGKGLLWRNFRLSIDLRTPSASGLPIRRQIGFKRLTTQTKANSNGRSDQIRIPHRPDLHVDTEVNSRAGAPGAAIISRPITARFGTAWRMTARSAAPSGSQEASQRTSAMSMAAPSCRSRIIACSPSQPPCWTVRG